MSPDPVDQATDPVVSTPGDIAREPDLPPDLSNPLSDPGEIPPRPKGERKPRSKESRLKSKLAASKAAELKTIRTSLQGILEAPALVISEPWPKAHVEAQAPNLAEAILRKAEADDDFRRKLANLLAAGDGAGLAIAALMYVAPLAIYYGAPAPPPVKAMLKIPPRPRRVAPAAEMVPDFPEDALAAEAAEHGFETVHEYQAAVAKAVAEADPNAVLPDE